MRIVLDTNILVRAIATPDGPARALLREIRIRDHHLLISQFILDEIRRVLHYPRIQSRWPVSEDEIETFTNGLREVALLVNLDESEPLEVVQDPDDSPILQTAVVGNVDVICTLDRHLRTTEVESFVESRGIRILTDVELLKEIRS